MADVDDPDDPIVEEYPIIMTKNLQDNLYVFQYPSNFHGGNFDDEVITDCRVKPMSHQIKVDVAMDTEARNYSRFKGEQIAIATDGKGASRVENPVFKSGLMDKQTFVSTEMLTDLDRYLVGVFNGQELHVTPLKGFVSFGPSFDYINRGDKHKSAEDSKLEDDESWEDAQQVTVKFQRAGANMRRNKARRKPDTDEPWCDARWHPSTANGSIAERLKLVGVQLDANTGAMPLDTSEYVHQLLPDVGEFYGVEQLLEPRVMNKVRMRGMSLRDQLRQILKDTKMLRFQTIVNIMQMHVDPSATSDIILRTLPQVGVLIYGNWVAQSEVLYPPETRTADHLVCADHMVRARDYLLYKFSRQPFVYRRQVLTAMQVPVEEGNQVLQSVARLQYDKRWCLLLPPDRDFEKQHPELMMRQERMWRTNEQIYLDMEKTPKRVRKRSLRDTKAHLQQHLQQQSVNSNLASTLASTLTLNAAASTSGGSASAT